MSAHKPASIFEQLKSIPGRRMPALDMVHEVFVRNLRSEFTNMLGSLVEIKALGSALKSYQEFLVHMPARSNIEVVGFEHVKGYGCWAIDPEILYTSIDRIFGGSGNLPLKHDPKKLSVTELRISRRILELIVREYEKAWEPLAQLQFNFVKHELNFNQVRFSANEETVLHCRFQVSLHDSSGYLDLCVPFWVMEPFKEKIWSNDVKVKREADSRWSNLLENQVQHASVNAVAVLARKEMTISEILGMSVGDIIPIEIDDPVTMFVDGLPMIRGKYGVKNGRYAVKVDSIQHPAEFIKRPMDSARIGPSMMRGEERGELYEQFKNTNVEPKPTDELGIDD